MIERTAPQGAGHFRRIRIGQESEDMKLIVKALAILVILGFIGLVGFAYLGDLSPDQDTVTQPVELDGQ
jgi:hypothetical protein